MDLFNQQIINDLPSIWKIHSWSDIWRDGVLPQIPLHLFGLSRYTLQYMKFHYFRILQWGEDRRFDDKREDLLKFAAFWAVQVYDCSLTEFSILLIFPKLCYFCNMFYFLTGCLGMDSNPSSDHFKCKQ